MKADLVVVGGGIGGLATAALAARGGLKVTLVERASHLGGRATTQEMGGGLFNQGPHALYRGGPAVRVLRKLGVAYKGRQPSSTSLWVARDGAIQPLTAGPLSLLGSPVLAWAGKLELARVLMAIQTVGTDALQSVTLDVWLNEVVRSTKVREVVQALTRVTTYTNAPQVMSAGAAIQQMRTALRHSVLYLDGGWQTLVDGLRTSAVSAGVELVAQARVEAIERDASGIRAVALQDGRRIETRRAVLAVSPSVAASLTGLPQLSRFAVDATPAHAACLDLALRRLPRPRTILAQGLDEPTYLSVHTRYARLSSNGVQVVHVAKYLPPGDAGLDARPRLEALTDLMQPGWRDELIEARFMPRMCVIQAIPRADRGGQRAPVVVSDVPGLFLVGDSIGSEGMLSDAVFASASLAAQEAVAFGRRSPQNARARETGQMVA